MKSGSPSAILSSTIGTVTGEFLGRFHTWTYNNANLLEYFKEDYASKETLEKVFYQSLHGLLTTEDAKSQ
ncbi:hypothetical protein BDQ12DRAFT_349764 [Crucibulum laeve]|uniref:Uncharacterized protein n=1 Tax=Crucibulum laeve TaxID=68775 RepID=A0A5C3MDR7_9AGAR|nr:hypothetical protein BDQ12DRAFT_349764 [Crucibulum laeve]